MEEFLRVMTLPFLACLVLTGIHAYLGLHVIERQVIFVDLALAQIAALGAALALVFGQDIESVHAYWLSLGLTVVGAGIFSLTRFKKQRIPQEAMIGIVYAVSAALLVLVLSRSGEGDEHIRQSLVGNILLVTNSEILKILLIYSAIGLFHFIFRDKFFLISQNPERAFEKGWNVRFWDFLFYLSFGFVVTSSVKIAGVLLVFSFLIVPAACAVLFSKKPGVRLMLGWGVGIAASLLGMAVSYFLDFPTGASVVCAFGGILVTLGVVRSLTQSSF
jgi:zinc/manganese transport system permease protein